MNCKCLCGRMHCVGKTGGQGQNSTTTDYPLLGTKREGTNKYNETHQIVMMSELEGKSLALVTLNYDVSRTGGGCDTLSSQKQRVKNQFGAIAQRT